MAGAHPTVAKNRLGWLEIAKGSSILLDEVDDLPVEIQRALVEAVETRRFWRVGSDVTLRLDVRFLAISRGDLREARASALTGASPNGSAASRSGCRRCASGWRICRR